MWSAYRSEFYTLPSVSFALPNNDGNSKSNDDNDDNNNNNNNTSNTGKKPKQPWKLSRLNGQRAWPS
ncbi:hypothetical protein T10_12523 [Trichinella papuae]|uniref:Uncharacterized protein n=1 Tax=Trichinella papuae TaxID=268474 RepID=A0A0V1N8G8_9BILA|nr:hypothetical protein T10_12523 [Trichinella papuae]